MQLNRRDTEELIVTLSRELVSVTLQRQKSQALSVA